LALTAAIGQLRALLAIERLLFNRSLKIISFGFTYT